jgi:NAD+ diphosphatase
MSDSLEDILSNIDSYSRQELRQFYAEHDEETSSKVFRAKALSEWRKKTVFCSRCGARLVESSAFTAMQCPDCGELLFPRIDPCIIVLVRKEGKILLARHTQRNQDIYACLAGYVEAGETIENAVRREIFEETGIRVRNIQYRGSQSWPFPQQLMLGFYADYESGEITCQKEEIEDARWFDPDNLTVATPAPGSIAYKLIHNEI